jgi:hypothetical protein
MKTPEFSEVGVEEHLRIPIVKAFALLYDETASHTGYSDLIDPGALTKVLVEGPAVGKIMISCSRSSQLARMRSTDKADRQYQPERLIHDIRMGFERWYDRL